MLTLLEKQISIFCSFSLSHQVTESHQRALSIILFFVRTIFSYLAGSVIADGRLGCVIGPSLGPFFDKRTGPMVLLIIFVFASKQCIMDWANSAWMMQLDLMLAVPDSGLFTRFGTPIVTGRVICCGTHELCRYHVLLISSLFVSGSSSFQKDFYQPLSMPGD